MLVAGAVPLVGGEQPVLVEKAKLASPEAVTIREESHMKYANLNTEQATTVDGEAFPAVADEPAGGPPKLPVGQSITAYPSDNAAQVDFDDGEHGVIESLAPIALEASPGQRVPVDLGLAETGGAFEPKTPVVGVRIPKRLDEGVALAGGGVSLTPVSEQGSSLGGSEGAVDGAAVFYTNTQTDADTVIKPSTWGFEADSVLRSINSPQRLFFRVGLPAGASLVQANGPGAVDVAAKGVTLARIASPSAIDAQGTPVPVSMSDSGDMLTLTVEHQLSEYAMPVVVDPTVEDRNGPAGEPTKTNWVFNPQPETSYFYNGSEEHDTLTEVNQHMEMLYQTQGESRIYQLEMESYSEVPHARSTLELIDGATEENGELLGNNVQEIRSKSVLCGKRGESTPCGTSGPDTNYVRFQQTANQATTPWSSIASADVHISQEKRPEPGFNITSPTIEYTGPKGENIKRENVLYPGSKGWLGPHTNTAFEVVAKDPGIGVSSVSLQDLKSGAIWLRPYEEGKCQGVQCHETVASPYTYNSEMNNGDNGVRLSVENATGALESNYSGDLRVDGTPPHSIKISGLPAGNEIGEGIYKLKAEATDGEGSVASSGIQSLKLGIDGAEATEPNGSCSPGPCTAHAEWTINGGELGAGPHTLTVVATDNANNIENEPFAIFVHHAEPAAVGPGSVDPESGNYSLGASDVSMGPGLTVSRTYSSRNLTAGAGGPFGPQWAASLSSDESLSELPDGSMLMTSASGGQVVFARNSKGEFESPTGDANLSLTVEENEQKVPIAYYLKDATAGTSVKFARSENYQQGAPTYYGQIGWQGFGSGQFGLPTGVATDVKGDVWVADTASDGVEEFNPQGTYVRAFDGEGTGHGSLKEPHGVGVNGKGDVWVADTGNNRIIEFTEAGGYVGEAGREGAGTLKEPRGIAIDGKGDVWVTDTGNNRVVEFSESGSYIREAERKVGSKELSEPLGVATDAAGDAWVTDAKNHRVVEYSAEGKSLKEVGSQGSKNGEFETPTGIAVNSLGDVWVADYAENRVQEFNSKGEYLTQFGTSGSEGGQFKKPYFLAIDGNGTIVVADTENYRVQKWGHALWYPTISQGALPTSTVTYHYETIIVEGRTVTRPTEALAPVPMGVSCSPMKEGCHALKFQYATSTTVTGEGEHKWGSYDGRLEKVRFETFNPSTKKMEEPTVAEYQYDKLGRLHAEWDPRISPELKTTYGYDAEGHVTALTPPGQETWAFTYGTIAGDSNPGRLLKVTRAPASAGLWNGEVVEHTETPAITGSPVVGVRLAVSSGKWSNSPVAYAYQWEDCNSSGEACTPILGATNQNYIPTTSDVGHTLVAEVLATNGGGTVTAASAHSQTVAASASTEITEYSLPSGSEPHGITAGPNGGLWFSSYLNGRIGKLSTSGSVLAEYSLTGVGADKPTPDAMVAGPEGDVWFTNLHANKVGKITEAGAISEYGLGEANYPTSIAVGPDGNFWTPGTTNGDIAKTTPGGQVTEYPVPADYGNSGPYGVTAGSNGEMWFTEAHTNSIAEITTSGTITNEFALPAGSSPISIVAGAEGDLWYTDQGSSKVGKITTSGTITEYSLPPGSLPEDITAGPEKESAMWFTEYGTGKIGKITASGALSEYSLPSGSDPRGITVGPEKENAVWFTEEGTGKIGKLNTSPAAGEAKPPQPGTTLEYQIPTSGTGLPTLTKSEAEKWGEKDDPVEGTAIFPPDEPQGWPASKYERATISYFDGQGRTVNVATPTGGIVTSEYNSANEITRTLSADNRVQALKESKPAEVAEKLDTKTEYNPENSEIVKVLGPEHKVKLSTGGEVEARTVTHNYYNEGAEQAEEKNQETYSLLTKSTSGALLSGGEEEDVRTTVTSYNGQKDLGWKLRKPTSTTIDPNGLDLVHKAVYEEHENAKKEIESTGDVVETRTPEGNSEHIAPPSFSSDFGSSGSGNGQFDWPFGIAIDPKGDIWVTDTFNNRVEEFNQKDEFLRKSRLLTEPFGITISSAGDIWVTEAGHDRVVELNEKAEVLREFGSEGTGNGQFEAPIGITINSSGDLWVTDMSDNRIEEFNEKGEFLKKIGASGNGDGQFNEPAGITTDSKGNMWVADSGNGRIEEFTAEGGYLSQFGVTGHGDGEFSTPYGVAVSSVGDVWVANTHNDRVEEFTEEGSYLQQFGKGGSGSGEMDTPSGIALDLEGNIWITDTHNNRVDEWAEGSESGSAHDTQTIYYSAEPNATHANCGKHPEWANLPCLARPAAQPAHGVSALPETTTTYNMWDEPETTTETFEATGSFPATTRTKKLTYDEAGRVLSTEETSTSGDATLPRVTDKYSTTTGQLTELSSTVGEETKRITSDFNTLGQLAEYTDAEGGKTTYSYDEDGRVSEVVAAKGTEAESKQIYAYDSTTGLLTKLQDSGAHTFTAGYDVEGNMTSESYPNGMTATYTRNAAGEATGIVYEKTVDCASKCPETWFSDSAVPSIHGEMLRQTSTLAKENYVYDKAGRLLETEERLTGKEGCSSRLYAYDEESNRTSQTTRESGTETCATEGGTVQDHTYDGANRLIDTGVTYEALGNVTSLPAVDAGGSTLESSYYADGQVAKQTQSEETHEYTLDPADRVLKTKSSGKTSATVISHYAGSGETPLWTTEGTGKWTRDIPGIDGSLAAVETNGGTPVLQIHDLQGNIVATASLNETETKLLTKYNPTEFGVPVNGAPPTKFSWLGATGVSSELSSGTLVTGTVSYVPQLGRALQTEAVTPPGAIPNGLGSGAAYVAQVTGIEIASGNEAAKKHAEEGIAEEKAAELAAQEKILQQCREEGGCGEEQGEEEFPDPEKKDNGEYGHLFIHYEDIKCADYGCSAIFSVNAVLTDAGRSTGMQLTIMEYTPSGGWKPYEEMVPVEDYGFTPDYNIGELIISYGSAFVFELKVRVGKHKETLRIEFFSVEGEGVV